LCTVLNNKIAEHFRKQFHNPTIAESQPDTNSGLNGFIAHFTDTEGNKAGLHSMK
jgi:hypothetical protein